MIRFTFILLKAIIPLVVTSFLFHNCYIEIEKDDNFTDCVGHLDPDEFHFLGTQNINYIINSSGETLGSANMIFTMDQTFTLNLFIECDKFKVNPWNCDSTNYVDGEKIITIKGTWDFTQQVINTAYSFCANQNGCPYSEIKGVCLLTISDSPDASHVGKEIRNDFGFRCAEYAIPGLAYGWMEIYLTFNEIDELEIILEVEK